MEQVDHWMAGRAAELWFTFVSAYDLFGFSKAVSFGQFLSFSLSYISLKIRSVINPGLSDPLFEKSFG